MAHTLTIGEVAKTSGVAAKTIRYYEEIGVWPTPRRTASGYRLYICSFLEAGVGHVAESRHSERGARGWLTTLPMMAARRSVSFVQLLGLLRRSTSLALSRVHLTAHSS